VVALSTESWTNASKISSASLCVTCFCAWDGWINGKDRLAEASDIVISR
jgi:hypothetical protein